MKEQSKLASNVPHPPWAKYAMRTEGVDDNALIAIYHNALKECPKDMNFAIRQVEGCLEWYAPIAPKSFEI